MKKKLLLIGMVLMLIFALVGCSSGEDPAQTADEEQQTVSSLEGNLIVSAAASLQEPMDKAYAAFHEQNPNVTIEFNYGGSGALIEQIENGAPADIFISANVEFMDEGVEAGVINTDTRFDWLKNTMAVIVPANSTEEMTKIEDVANANNIALGTVESVPAGQYAKAALEKAGIWADVEGKVVYGKDVKQVVTYVESGSADVGFVYATDTVGRDAVKTAFILSDDLVEPIIYPAAIVADSQAQDLAAAFLTYLQSDEAAAFFTEYGFEMAQ